MMATPSRSKRPPRLWTLIASLALLALGLLALAAQEPADSAASSDPDARQLALQNVLLERELELADSKAFYLIVRMDDGQASLGLEGTTLQRYVVGGLSVGTARIAFRARESPTPWAGIIWTGGQLDPPREVRRPAVAIAGAESGSPTLVPPTPEEAYPVPSGYALTFTGGLRIDVRVVPDEVTESFATRGWRAVAGWVASVRDALRPADERGVRLRLDLPLEDAEALYRTLPPDVQLLVIPPGLTD